MAACCDPLFEYCERGVWIIGMVWYGMNYGGVLVYCGRGLIIMITVQYCVLYFSWIYISRNPWISRFNPCMYVIGL